MWYNGTCKDQGPIIMNHIIQKYSLKIRGQIIPNYLNTRNTQRNSSKIFTAKS